MTFARFGDRGEKDRDPDFDVYLYSVGKGADGKCRIGGGDVFAANEKVNMHYCGKSEIVGVRKDGKDGGQTIWVYPDAEEGWDKS